MVKNKTPKTAGNRKPLLYVMLGLLGLVVLYFSFDVVPLDEHRKTTDGVDINPILDSYFEQTLPAVLTEAIAPCDLLEQLKDETSGGWEQYGKQTAIGNRYYFLFRGQGIIKALDDDFMTVAFGPGERGCTLRVSTVYLFGNEIRDASGKLLLDDIGDLGTFNTLSEAINKRVRETVVAPFLKTAAVGKPVEIAGAFALNRRVGLTDDLEIKPIQLQFIDEARD